MRKVLSVMLLVLVASVVGAVVVNKGAGAAGVPQDLQALATVVQNGFAAVQHALSDIQNSLNSLSAAGDSNVRFTPLVTTFSPDVASCLVVNVTNATRTVRIQPITILGGVLSDHQADLPAGVGQGESFVANGAVYCKFIVVDGSRTDIRGSLAISSTFSSDNKLSVPAE